MMDFNNNSLTAKNNNEIFMDRQYLYYMGRKNLEGLLNNCNLEKNR